MVICRPVLLSPLCRIFRPPDGILEGDWIVINYQDHAVDGDLIVALLKDEGATVKRLARKEGKMFLMPSNPEHLPIPVPDGEDLQIQGRVVGIAR